MQHERNENIKNLTRHYYKSLKMQSESRRPHNQWKWGKQPTQKRPWRKLALTKRGKKIKTRCGTYRKNLQRLQMAGRSSSFGPFSRRNTSGNHCDWENDTLLDILYSTNTSLINNNEQTAPLTGLKDLSSKLPRKSHARIAKDAFCDTTILVDLLNLISREKDGSKCHSVWYASKRIAEIRSNIEPFSIRSNIWAQCQRTRWRSRWDAIGANSFRCIQHKTPFLMAWALSRNADTSPQGRTSRFSGAILASKNTASIPLSFRSAPSRAKRSRMQNCYRWVCDCWGWVDVGTTQRSTRIIIHGDGPTMRQVIIWG